MKKLYFLFLLMLLPILASAADKVEIDGIYYELSIGETKTATVISGTNKYSGEVVIPETVTYNEETYSVTSIGGMTFLKIGNSISSISSIGNSAFCNCTGLTSVTIPNSVTSIGDGAFWGCTGLTSLTIGSNVASIGVLAFGRCNGLTSVSIPKSVTSIGNFAFYDCRDLGSINVETGNTEYDSRDNCNAIIETQSNTLLSGCNNTIIPSNVISIADKAFYNCSGLTSVTIPNGVTFIGEDAFHACSGLTSITIPNSVISIGDLAFSDCSGLTSVTIPNSVTSIGLYPFRACRGLTSIEVEGGNTKYDSRDNCNAIIETQSNTLMSGCKNTFIPNGVTSIGDYAFYASGLTSVTIPNSVTSIGNYAFWACGMTSVTIPNSVTFIGALAFKYCNKLTSVTIPNSVTSISNDVFNNCSKLTSMTIPNSVTSIGSCAFESCVSLKDVYCYAENVPETRASAFTYCNLDNVSLHVPAGSVDAYKVATPWSGFKEVVPIETKTINVETAGTLPTLISDAEKYTIEELTIAGELNGTDIRLIREMAGNNYKGEVTEGKLRVLDLSGASIVEGGDPYIESSSIKTTVGATMFPIYGSKYSTNKDVISYYMFAGCNSLQSIKLPAGITSIRFSGFAYCTNMESITILDKVTYLETAAFQDCRNLASIRIPKSVTKIYGANFSGCNSMSSIIVEEGNSQYDSRDNCNAVIETEENRLIIGCSATTIPNTVTTIGIQAFMGCQFTSISIPPSVKNIEYGAFDESALTSITIPSTVESIGIQIFSQCNQLTSIVVESGNPNYDSRENSNAIIETATNKLIATCSTTVVPSSVTALGEYTFAHWKEIPSNLLDHVKIICDDAFYNALFASIVIPEGVEIIGEEAFRNANLLESIELPISLTSIGDNAFSACSKLDKIVSYQTDPIEISDNVFGSMVWDSSTHQNVKLTSKATLYVPAGTKEKYQATAGWKEFTNIVELEEQDTNIDFADPNVKEICVANWDTNGDGELSKLEASLVTEIDISNNQNITSFDEFEFFIGIKDNFSFQGCSNLKSIKIPNSVISIGPYAFEDCRGLTSVTIPNSVTTIGNWAFGNCNGLTSVTIPNSVTSIGSSAFSCCQKLSSVTISNSVTSIGNRAFSNCAKLTSIVVESGNMVYDSRDNCNAIIETSTNTLITGCKETIIPNSVTSIGDEAFSGSGLITINLSSNITSIGKRAFDYCEHLESLSLPKNVSFIGELAFSACWSLTSINVDSENAKYDSRDNCNAIIETATNTLVAGCTNTVIPESVTSIGKCGMGQSGITTFTIPGNVETIEDYGFYNCPDLVFLVVSEGVKTIGSYAFESCALENLILPSTIEYIGSRAFADNRFSSVTIYAEDVPQTEVNIFKNTKLDNATLYVPYGTKSKYEQAEGWKDFKNIVEMAETESIKISSAKQVTYMSDKNLDFTAFPNLKAYVATGYDKASGTIWLTRVKEIPANTGFLLMGEANTYEIPVKAGGLSAYYQNMFKGTIEGTTIQTTEGDYTNYYLSNGDAGVGFYKVQGSVELKPNRAYLSVPTEIPAVGATGSTETIKVSAAGQVPYYNSKSLDFSSLDAQGVKAYTATGYDYSSGTIWLTRVKQVPAETGILIMAPQGEYPVPTASVASVYANMFKGTLTGTTIQTHETIAGEDYINYYLSSGDAGVGFYKVTKEGGVTIGANRCYLPILNKEVAGTRSAGSGQNQIAFEEADEVIGIPLLRGIGGDEDGTTAVKEVKSGEVKGEEWYTLQGQRVAKPGKGIYIHNGKKVVIK